VRLREPFTFFIDRSLGGEVVAKALREAGERVVAHAEEFADDAADVEWLSVVGKKQWIVLTKDARIRTNALEREALLAAGVAAFMLGRGDISGAQMAAAFVTSLSAMKRALRRWKAPMIGTVSTQGAVSMLYADGERLPRIAHVKP
jgi:predicted nuclease of predicted toxin-antitoxin system